MSIGAARHCCAMRNPDSDFCRKGLAAHARGSHGRHLELSSFNGRRDFEAVAVLGDRASGDDDVGFTQALDNAVVGKNVFWIFLVDHPADALADGLGRVGVARIWPRRWRR